MCLHDSIRYGSLVGVHFVYVCGSLVGVHLYMCFGPLCHLTALSAFDIFDSLAGFLIYVHMFGDVYSAASSDSDIMFCTRNRAR